MESRTTVFLTGATGHMGHETLKLLAPNQRIRLKLLSLGDRASRRILASFRGRDNVEIIEGDLRNIDDIRRGVEGADYVLHLGALIPPVADRHPELTEQINLGGTLNVIQAIREQADPDSIRLVYIATVASLGNRPAPVHWGRVGDPIKVSKYDAYSISKVKAERAVIESGLRHWVSLRQSGMLHKDYLRLMDPIMFHQPLNNHIEWSTAQDSGQALYNLVTMDLPDEFWRTMYNIGSGPEFRDTYYNFLKTIFAKMGVRDIHKILRRRDFATRNFHCVWYTDSDRLEEWLHFRKSTYQGFWDTLEVPFYCRLTKLLPPLLMRKLVMEPLARRADGTLNWIENDRTDRVNAYFGSRENWTRIPESWEGFSGVDDPGSHLIIHGFEETKAPEKIDLADCRQAAAFRGGECLSTTMTPGDLHTPLRWRCFEGHEFQASPNLVLRAGHWCPSCDLDEAHYGRQAEHSRFFAQVYDG